MKAEDKGKDVLKVKGLNTLTTKVRDLTWQGQKEGGLGFVGSSALF